MAAISRDHGASAVRVVDLSSEGSKIDCHDVGGTGEWVEFRRNDIAVRGRVVWADGQRSGVEFEEPIDISDMLRRVPAPRSRPRPTAWRPPVTTTRLSRAERDNLDWWVNCLGVARNDSAE